METVLPYMYMTNPYTIYRRETLVPSIQVYHVMLVVYNVRDYFSLPVHGHSQVADIANRKIATCNQLTDTDSSHAAEAAFTSETFNSSQSSFSFSPSVNSQYIDCLSVSLSVARLSAHAEPVPTTSQRKRRYICKQCTCKHWSHVHWLRPDDLLFLPCTSVHWLRPDDLTHCGGSDNYR